MSNVGHNNGLLLLDNVNAPLGRFKESEPVELSKIPPAKLIFNQDTGLRISLPSTTKRLRQLDEAELNRLFGDTPDDVLQLLIRKKLPDPNKRRAQLLRAAKSKLPVISHDLKEAILSLRLLDEPSMERRAQIFIGYCRYKNYSYNTTIQYFRILRVHKIFGDPLNLNVRPDRCAFVDSGRNHTRIVSIDNFKTYARYLSDHFSEYTAPLLVSVYTGLRTFEILQMTTYTLFQLKERHNVVAIKRKHTVISSLADDATHWVPVYNTYLNALVNKLIELYQNDYDMYQSHGFIRKLFYLTPKTLGNRLRTLYFNAVGTLPPLGFGVHSSRNMMAMIMANTSENILAIQQFLQHKHLKQTRRYMKADFTHTTDEFNRLTNYELQDVRTTLTGLTHTLASLRPVKDTTKLDLHTKSATRTEELQSKAVERKKEDQKKTTHTDGARAGQKNHLSPSHR